MQDFCNDDVLFEERWTIEDIMEHFPKVRWTDQRIWDLKRSLKHFYSNIIEEIEAHIVGESYSEQESEQEGSDSSSSDSD